MTLSRREFCAAGLNYLKARNTMSAEQNPEITSLNADNMDAGQLDDASLEDVAGGVDSCGTFTCGTYHAAPTIDP